jgi:hypothetical protein
MCGCHPPMPAASDSVCAIEFCAEFRQINGLAAIPACLIQGLAVMIQAVRFRHGQPDCRILQSVSE